MNIFNALLPLLIGLCVLAIPVGIILGIVMATKVSGEVDKKKKNNWFWISVLSFVGPIVMIFLLVTLWGLSRILITAFGLS